MGETTEELIERLVAAARPVPNPVVERHGEWLQEAHNATFGFACLGYRAARTEAEAKAAQKQVQDTNDAEFRATLVAMSTDALAGQVESWL